MVYPVFAKFAGTVHEYEPELDTPSAIAVPIARLPALLPYRSCKVTLVAVVGVHVIVNLSPACRVPPRGLVIASGLFWAPVNVASNEAAVARILKKRIVCGEVQNGV